MSETSTTRRRAGWWVLGLLATATVVTTLVLWSARAADDRAAEAAGAYLDAVVAGDADALAATARLGDAVRGWATPADGTGVSGYRVLDVVESGEDRKRVEVRLRADGSSQVVDLGLAREAGEWVVDEAPFPVLKLTARGATRLEAGDFLHEDGDTAHVVALPGDHVLDAAADPRWLTYEPAEFVVALDGAVEGEGFRDESESVATAPRPTPQLVRRVGELVDRRLRTCVDDPRQDPGRACPWGMSIQVIGEESAPIRRTVDRAPRWDLRPAEYLELELFTRAPGLVRFSLDEGLVSGGAQEFRLSGAVLLDGDAPTVDWDD